MNRYVNQQRSVPLIIVLSIITCGIYQLIWMYKVNNELNRYNQDSELNPGLSIFLGFITCGIYFLFWWYKMGEKMMIAQMSVNAPVNDYKLLYLLLSLFGFGIVNMGILQYDLNYVWMRADELATVNEANQYAQTNWQDDDDDFLDF